jgi:hypothetical protein
MTGKMLCAWLFQYPHRPIPPDQSRNIEVNGTGSVVVPRRKKILFVVVTITSYKPTSGSK